MLFDEFISSYKKGTPLYLKNKLWVDYKTLYEHFIQNNIPNSVCEEWKNFDTSKLYSTSWKLPILEEKQSKLNKQITYENCVVIVDGIYNKELSNLEDGNYLRVIPLEEYKKINKSAENLIYNNPSKYSENRLSGIKDTKSTSLLSVNTILNNGVVIEVERNVSIKDNIKILNLCSGNNEFINPYVLIICNEASKANFVDISDNTNNNWINPFYEFYIRKKAKVKFSSVQSNSSESFTTSSLNFHLYKNSSLNFSLLNKENSKKDIRVFLKENEASAEVNGLLVSSNDKVSDTFCKIVHLARDTKSSQKWRLVSIDKSKTSVIGKIVVKKGSNKSDAKFHSKSLIMNEKASSYSRPELEIFEGDIACSHGASFGEIDKDKLFYLQSRGIKKNDALKMLLLSFINEINISDDFVRETILTELNNYI